MLIFGLPFSLYLLQQSLISPDGFHQTRSWLDSAAGSFAVWLGMVSLAFHAFAGLRHLALDMHWGVEKRAARRSAWLVLLASAFTAALTAGWLML